jgi:PEP-CTERM motif
MRNWLMTCAALAAFSAPFAAGGSAQALAPPAATIDITQVGANVVVTGSGVIDLSGLSLYTSGPFPTNGVIWPAVGEILVGVGIGGPGVDVYTGASGPATMGTGLESLGSSATGDQFGVGGSAYADVGQGPVIFVPEGYVTDTPLSGTATFDNTTLAALGLSPGTYTYTWAPSVTATDGSLTVNVSSTVPEPSTWAMMALGFAGLGLLAYRKRGTLAAA